MKKVDEYKEFDRKFALKENGARRLFKSLKKGDQIKIKTLRGLNATDVPINREAEAKGRLYKVFVKDIFKNFIQLHVITIDLKEYDESISRYKFVCGEAYLEKEELS